MHLKDYIKVYNIFSEDNAKELKEHIENLSMWSTHIWNNYDNTSKEYNEDFQVIYGNDLISENHFIFDQINKFTHQGMAKYISENEDIFCDKTSIFRLNKFVSGTSMISHWDRISDIFPNNSGCPIFSIVGIINDDYDGGDFIFDFGEEKYSPEIKSGDMMFFPSSYPWKHYVDKIKKGTRYSWVCWAF